MKVITWWMLYLMNVVSDEWCTWWKLLPDECCIGWMSGNNFHQVQHSSGTTFIRYNIHQVITFISFNIHQVQHSSGRTFIR
jgi:hypothetical protein